MQRGQASLEYVAVVALVCLVLAIAGAAATGAGEVTQAVGAQLRRALCIVTGGDCLGDRPHPCVVGARRHSRDTTLTVAVARLGDGRTVLREELSDGTFAVTVVQSNRAGATLSLAQLRMAPWAMGGLSGAFEGRAAYGRRFLVPDRRAADRLIERLDEEDADMGGAVRAFVGALRGGEPDEDGPRADERFLEAGAGADMRAHLQALLGDGQAAAVASSAFGVRHDRRSGERTVYLALDGDLAAALATPLARVGGGLPGRTGVALTLDRGGRPVRLTVSAVRAAHGGVRFGGRRARTGGRVEAEARLDLDDPVARGLARTALRAARGADPRRALAAARRLGERMVRQARVDLRLFETERDERTRRTGLPLLGGVVRREVEVTEHARLVDAVGYDPGLGWRRRLDCVALAA
jgi:hypothetical protein